ncbi:Cloroperoxidase [Mytilinidion resinicola]|uniref:Cloroperoxidase n=1 Tax=Mytilinidion resinicola TaxID=574789 RepID=A0A6A6YBZ8_9PEZI|nr:Cloroperoxidase [Mytilinidion resinicola]KAF2805367.1 Cloroperoxidase [Mytilinidion resinicola]
MATTPPEGHPPVDWTKWEPAGDGDVRSPCPMINALANHHVLPHDGKQITKEMAIAALVNAIKLDSKIAAVFAGYAVTANPDASAGSFDLDMVDKHGMIEHDVSLSRSDYALGDNHTFDKGVWEGVMSTYEGKEQTDFATVSKARYRRVLASKKAHEEAQKAFEYGIKEFVLSYGESALFLGILGDPKDGKIPVEYLRVLFEQERLPFNEGWRPNEKVVTQTDMNHLIFKLIMANEHKAAEAAEVGVGSVHAVAAAVTGVMSTYCTVM